MVFTMFSGVIANPAVWFPLAVLTVLGTIALLSPTWFGRLATRGSRWVDTSRLLAVLDRRIDIDAQVIPFSRVLGFAVLASVVLIAVLLKRV